MNNKKNILVIMCDHLRYDSIGVLGNSFGLTPNIDRLAHKSVRFTNCFAQSPICSPARYSLVTGRYVHAHGVVTNEIRPKLGLYTIGHALREHGYRRFDIGHMHWTDTVGTDPDFDTGFEKWITMKNWRETMPPDALKRFDWENQTISKRITGGPSTRKKNQYWGHHVAINAIQQMTSAVERKEPFLCWVSFWEPHPPFYPPKEFYEKIDQSLIPIPQQSPKGAPLPHQRIFKKRQEWAHLTPVEIKQMIAGYYGLVALVDEYIGMVLKAVEELDIQKDTIIIFVVDHGEQLWEHQVFLKFVFREASVHVPLFICHPDIQTGIRHELVEQVDIFPTICELTNTHCATTVHGRSLGSLLGNRSTPDGWRTAVFSQIGSIQPN